MEEGAADDRVGWLEGLDVDEVGGGRVRVEVVEDGLFKVDGFFHDARDGRNVPASCGLYEMVLRDQSEVGRRRRP